MSSSSFPFGTIPAIVREGRGLGRLARKKGNDKRWSTYIEHGKVAPRALGIIACARELDLNPVALFATLAPG